jgi:hypothetical protein
MVSAEADTAVSASAAAVTKSLFFIIYSPYFVIKF